MCGRLVDFIAIVPFPADQLFDIDPSFIVLPRLLRFFKIARCSPGFTPWARRSGRRALTARVVILGWVNDNRDRPLRGAPYVWAEPAPSSARPETPSPRDIQAVARWQEVGPALRQAQGEGLGLGRADVHAEDLAP